MQMNLKRNMINIKNHLRKRKIKKEIHYYIFQELYDFAGKIREEDIIKGNTHFAKYQYIVSNAIQLFEELKNENHLLNTSVDQFAKRTAHYMAELNILHPFRDSNGRAIR
jgi:cell filamentation protein